MYEPLRLLLKSNDDLGVAMAETVDRKAPDEVKVLLAIGAPYLHPTPFSEDQRESVIGIHQVVRGILYEFLNIHAAIITQKSLKNQTDRL